MGSTSSSNTSSYDYDYESWQYYYSLLVGKNTTLFILVEALCS